MLRKLGKIAYFIGTGLLIAALMLNFIPPTTVFAGVDVTLCHRTGSDSNPYVTNTVSVNSVEDWLGKNGHGNHAEDIWAGFHIPDPLPDGTDIAAQGDQSILANGCNIPSTASVNYSIGTCSWTQAGGSLTPVTVTIIGDAIVHTGSVAGDITTSQILNLAPGSYTWPWEAIAPAYTGSGTLSFIIGDRKSVV